MKDIILGSILTLSLLADSAVLYGQTSDSYGNRLTKPTRPADITGRSDARSGHLCQAPHRTLIFCHGAQILAHQHSLCLRP